MLRKISLSILLICSFVSYGYCAILVYFPNGTYVPKPNLATVVSSPDCANKLVVITSPLSAVQSNISSASVHAWPPDKVLMVMPGGSINPTTKFIITGTTRVTPKIFGAACDGITDDTANVQLAVNATAYSGLALFVDSLCGLGSSVMINRNVDNTHNTYRIIGTNSDSGFVALNSSMDMFSSTNTYNCTGPGQIPTINCGVLASPGPVSEHISFEGIKFSNANGVSGSYVLNGDKFLRMQFWNDYFYGINLATTNLGYQTYSIKNSYLTGWSGVWMGTTSGGTGLWAGKFINVIVDNLKAEFGDQTNSTVFSNYGVMASSHFINGLGENFKGPYLITGGFIGGSIENNHFEAINTTSISMGAQANGLRIASNDFVSAPSGGYNIILNNTGSAGEGYAISSTGNFSSDSLYDDRLVTPVGTYGDGLCSQGDIPDTNLYYGLAGNSLTRTATLTGFSAPPSNTSAHIARNCNTITVSYISMAGTSNSTAMSMTGVIPTSWLPTSPRYISVPVLDSSSASWIQGLLVIYPAGTSSPGQGMFFYKDAGANPFTASGTKGIGGTTITYNIFP